MQKRLWIVGVMVAAVGVPIAIAGARSPRAEPVAAALASAAAVPEPRAEPPRVEAVPPALPRAAAEVAPFGKRVAIDAPLSVRFEVDVDRASVERTLSLDPPAAGRVEWVDARELRFVPERWRAGRAYRVRVGGVAASGEPLALADWQFRTGVPEPLAITPGEGQPIVLTFDDGPHKRRQADRLLDILRDHGARAIFFPTGRWIGQRKDWVERAVREGHRVCNHTFSHQNLTQPWVTEAEIRREIEKGASDGTCKYFRPPLMAVDRRVERIVKELGYELYFWDIDSRDWDDAPSRDVENLVLARAAPGKVVLMHIHSRGTLLALPVILRRLKAAGYVLTHEGTRPPALPPVVEGAMETHPE